MQIEIKGKMHYSLFFTKEEIEDIIINLDQCFSEGYINSGDPAFKVYEKFLQLNEELWKILLAYDFLHQKEE